MIRTALPLAPSLLLALAACHAPTPVGAPEPPRAENPKWGDLVLEPGEEHLRHESLTLAREYWIVVRKPGGDHYVYPRPDGAPAIAEACAKGDEAKARFAAYGLCQAASSEEAVRRANSLTREDALFVSSFLHSRLGFRAESGRVEPTPATSDIIALCREDAALRRGALKERCDHEERYAQGGRRPDLFRAYTDAELAALPPALNRLYGVAQASE